MKINIQELSSQYMIRQLNEEDIHIVYELYLKNPQYFKLMNTPLTLESVRDDMTGLPPGKTSDDKYYIGFYNNDVLLGVMDLIIGYPNDETAYIGLFMIDKDNQSKGLGTNIIHETLTYLNQSGFRRAELGVIKHNEQAKHFWHKNQFIPTGREVEIDNNIVICMERKL